MLNTSTMRSIFIAILLLSCTATSAYASIFELEIVPISKINEDPTAYDSTMAYRRISVIGNFSEITKQSAILSDNGDSLIIDIAKMELFEGFNISEQALLTGEFKYDPLEDSTFTPTYVIRYPDVDLGTVSIGDINSNSSYYNGKYLTVTGNLTKIESSMSRYSATVEDENGESIKINYYGSTELVAGEEIKVYGLYNGNILHTENMALNTPPFSISTLVPGFSSTIGALAILSMALLLKSKRNND